MLTSPLVWSDYPDLYSKVVILA